MRPPFRSRTDLWQLLWPTLRRGRKRQRRTAAAQQLEPREMLAVPMQVRRKTHRTRFLMLGGMFTCICGSSKHGHRVARIGELARAGDYFRHTCAVGSRLAGNHGAIPNADLI